MRRKSANNRAHWLHSFQWIPPWRLSAFCIESLCEADKRFRSFSANLGYRGACYVTRGGTQIREHKTGSPGHIVIFSVARVLPLFPGIVFPYEEISTFSKEPSVALLPAAKHMDRLKYLTNQTKKDDFGSLFARPPS